MNGPWAFCYSGVSTANRLIYQFTTLSANGQVDATVAGAYLAELTSLRSFFYWQLIDLYGNVPYDNDFANAQAAPPQVPRATVFHKCCCRSGNKCSPSDKKCRWNNLWPNELLGRKILTGKLYMNSQVYSGTAQWDAAIAACDEIINSGNILWNPIILPISM